MKKAFSCGEGTTYFWTRESEAAGRFPSVIRADLVVMRAFKGEPKLELFSADGEYGWGKAQPMEMGSIMMKRFMTNLAEDGVTDPLKRYVLGDAAGERAKQFVSETLDMGCVLFRVSGGIDTADSGLPFLVRHAEAVYQEFGQ